MSFCPHCGVAYEGAPTFCSSCGSALNGVAAAAPQQMAYQPQNSMQQVAQARQDALNEMQNMMAYFGQKKPQYDRYDEVTDLIAKFLRKRAVPLLVWGIIITAISLLVVGTAGKAAIGMLALTVIGLGMIGGFIALNVDRNKRLKNWYAERSDLANELEQHYMNYGFCLVGMEYTNPDILAAIHQVISVGRADSPKEAINVLLDDVHKNNMEMMAEQTAVNAAAAARGANVAAGFAAASFFLG